MQETIFPDGIMFSLPQQGAPDFIKGRLSFSVEKAVAWLEANKSETGWVNVDVKKSKGGKLYLSLNTYKPAPPKDIQELSEDPDKIPF